MRKWALAEERSLQELGRYLNRIDLMERPPQVRELAEAVVVEQIRTAEGVSQIQLVPQAQAGVGVVRNGCRSGVGGDNRRSGLDLRSAACPTPNP